MECGECMICFVLGVSLCWGTLPARCVTVNFSYTQPLTPSERDDALCILCNSLSLRLIFDFPVERLHTINAPVAYVNKCDFEESPHDDAYFFSVR